MIFDKPKSWHKRASSVTKFIDCSVDRSKLPESDEILKKRDGSVLAVHTILKADHFYRGIKEELGIRLLGAPNFRKTDLNIYGVAQPNLSGLYTLLTLLGCSPLNPEESACSWFNTREEPLVFVNDEPFVLREHSNPSTNIKTYAGINRERLELMEERLKKDVLNEATSNGGLILVHDERDDETVYPCYVAIDSVKTSAEVFQELLNKGYRVEYHRIPMSHGLSPMDPFIDDYIEVFRRIPLSNSVVFSCGLGIGRTTFSMLAGLLIRRYLTIEKCGLDPLDENVSAPVKNDVLRLIVALETALGKTAAQQSAIQWVNNRDQILDNLMAALHGNYKCVLDLVRVLENGVACKKIVDKAIDRCEDMLNLRESILIGRVRHSIHVPDSLELALAFLERYFTLIALCGYLDEGTCGKFSNWIRERGEIWNMFSTLRKDSIKLKVFVPIGKLSSFAKTKSIAYTKEAQAEANVLQHRAGSILVPHTILKMDSWSQEYKLPTTIDGAWNFRKMNIHPIYAVAQPKLQAIEQILHRIVEEEPSNTYIVWINIREEPIVYIHNEPYVLRDKFVSLRNLRSYSGIPSDRLELMERKLKEDIVTEAALYNQQILLHAEDPDGDVVPVWQAIDCTSCIHTMKEALEVHKMDSNSLGYFRIPVTAEDAPEPADFDFLIKIISSVPIDKLALIFNCQIGAGRSTTGMVISAQIINWLKNETITSHSSSEKATDDIHHYKAVHSILRTIRFGLESKHAVDMLIDEASSVVNLRTVITEWKERAEKASDPNESRKALLKGASALKRYCALLLFQAYLNENAPTSLERIDTMETFAQYMVRHPEFVKLLLELESRNATLETLCVEMESLDVAEGHALTNEVAFVISDRQGSVLAPLTILKYDHFPGCQKTSLPERIEGAPNFREVLMPSTSTSSKISIYGMAMPMAESIKDVLARMRAQPNGSRSVLWISLREEPVVFIVGRPFVLRVVKDPIANIEMTGIISERVESMEVRLKDDVLNEIARFGDKILLHEEELTKYGYDLVPVWENAVIDQVSTPSEIYSSISSEGYNLTYTRIPITDEQAPIPAVFDILFNLIWNNPQGTDLIFNCQMGRGRTTTGMIIASLIYLIRNGIIIEPSSPIDEDLTNDSHGHYNQRYLAGEYKLILHLTSVLEHGKLPKIFADYGIDLCAHIQNLREAILNYKLRVESADPNEKNSDETKRVNDIKHMGLNYLVRYFYLVVFSEFVMQRNSKDPSSQASDHEFSEWLRQRREITNLVSRPKNIDFS